MGKASQALRWILENYGISQNKLAVAMGISRANVGRWFHGLDPSAENIVAITKALKEIDRYAAKEFVRQYLGEIVEDDSD
jgi:transcriptional regulator with XRE-family HTH domain